MAAANDITITVIDLAYRKHNVSISQNATIKDLQNEILELRIVEAPSKFHLRLWKPSNNGITPIIFNKLDRTLANYHINNNATIHVLMDPDQTYYNLNISFPQVKAKFNYSNGGKRSRRNRKSRCKSRRKTRRNRK